MHHTGLKQWPPSCLPWNQFYTKCSVLETKHWILFWLLTATIKGAKITQAYPNCDYFVHRILHVLTNCSVACVLMFFYKKIEETPVIYKGFISMQNLLYNILLFQIRLLVHLQFFSCFFKMQGKKLCKCVGFPPAGLLLLQNKITIHAIIRG